MIQAPAGVKEVKITAIVTRADGSREDLGVVSYWHKNPLIRAIKAIWHDFNRH